MALVQAARLQTVLVAIACCGAGLSCISEDRPEVVLPPGLDAGQEASLQEREDAEEPEGGQDASIEGAAIDGDAETLTTTPGLVPTARDATDAESPAELRSEALLMAVSAGARGIVVERDWSALTDASGAPSSQAWAELEAIASFLRERRVEMLLQVRIVDTTIDRRPSGIASSAWNLSATRTAMHALIDRLYATCGEELRTLSLGEQLDVYVQRHPAQASAFTQLAAEALEYAKTHPNKPSLTQVGWTWSAAAWLPPNAGIDSANALLSGSDIVALSYYPLDVTLHARPPSVVAGDIAILVDRIKDKPIVMQHASYPSSALIGGSEDAESQFVEGLFASVQTHRDRFAFVGIASLHDPAPEECLRFAAAQGLPASAELFAFWCSTGLRQRDGTAKAAFASFVAGASASLGP